MSATLISNNTTIKISSAVSATATANNNTTTIYTCPASSYAIVNVAVTSNGATSGSIQVDSRIVAQFGNGITFPNVAASGPAAGFTVYVGPGQVLAVASGSAGNVTATATGVCFINTP